VRGEADVKTIVGFLALMAFVAVVAFKMGYYSCCCQYARAAPQVVTVTVTQTALSHTAASSAPAAEQCPQKPVVLRGSGSTFVWPAMNAWASGFHRVCPTVTVEYAGGGSGKGQKDIIERLVDFAGSDPPLASKYVKEYRGKIMQFPVVLGAVVVSYNIPGLDKPLRLNGTVLAEIYLGKIRYWDDPAIRALNPGVKLPHHEIIAVHRSDASGTTQIFTTFLYKSSHGLWPRSLVGKVIDWPVDKTGRGIGQQGNPGVVEAIRSTPYSIGYVEWAYALEYKLPVALIENPYGRFIAPSKEAISAAFNLRNPPSPLDDWTKTAESFVYSNASKDAYPIAGQTFLIVWRKQSNPDKCLALKAFIRYVATEGQGMLPRGYAPLPTVLRKVALEAAKLLECPASGG